jgi:hypothetical protein
MLIGNTGRIAQALCNSHCASIAACMMLCAAASAIAQQGPPVFVQPGAPVSPPAGEERARIVEGIRKSYPTMPGAIVELLADGRRAFNDLTRCEVLDFLIQPSSGAAEAIVTRARDMVHDCALGIEDITSEVAAARLAGRAFAYYVSANSVTVIARSGSDEARMCCTFDAALAPIGGSGFRAARRRIADTSAGILVVGATAPDIPNGAGAPTVWRGPASPPASARKAKADLKGVVLERTLQSTAIGETRRLSVYLPPGHSNSRAWPVLFLADGAAEGFAPMVEAMIDRQEIAPIVMVSAHAGVFGIVGKPPEGYVDLRVAEYVRKAPGMSNEARFANHMTFFVDELARYAVAEFDVASEPRRRAVAGF